MYLFNFFKLIILFLVLFNIVSCGPKKKKELKDYQLSIDNLSDDSLSKNDGKRYKKNTNTTTAKNSELQDENEEESNKSKKNPYMADASGIDYSEVAIKKNKEKENKEIYHLVNKGKGKKTKRGGLKMPSNFNDNFTVNRIEKYGYVTTLIIKMPAIQYITQSYEEKKDLAPDRYQIKFRKYAVNPKITDSIKETLSIYTNYINTFNNNKTIFSIYIYDSGTSLDFNVDEKLALKNFAFELKQYLTTLNPNQYYVEIIPMEGVEYGELFIVAKKYDGTLNPNAYFLNKTNSYDSKTWFEKINQSEKKKNSLNNEMQNNNKIDSENKEQININTN